MFFSYIWHGSAIARAIQYMRECNEPTHTLKHVHRNTYEYTYRKDIHTRAIEPEKMHKARATAEELKSIIGDVSSRQVM